MTAIELNRDEQVAERTGSCLTSEEFAKQVLASFGGHLAPPSPKPFYRLAIVLVAFLMVLLPLIYLGLILGAIYVVWMHATVWGPSLLASESHHGGRNGVRAFLLGYLGPLAAGGILILFMLKPLIAVRPKREEHRALNPNDEPLLFAFLARLCDTIGAARPRRVEVDCQVNASASFRDGWWGMVTNQLILTIGTPLVSGLTLRQFTGVLAHEFGHFTQGAGMRLTYFIRSINAWFARVVYERDAWDEGLVSWGQHLPIRELQFVVLLAQACIWLTRRILWVLMTVGHVVSSFMLRQMEFNADLYETRVVGSDTFTETANRLQLLNLGWHKTMYDLRQLMTDGQLADNVCELLQINVGQVPADVIQKIAGEKANESTSWFSTHPSDKDRVANAQRDKAPGVFQFDGRAEQLFANFSQLSREVSEGLYREALGDDFKAERLIPVAQVVARQVSQHEEVAAGEAYFGAALNQLRTLDLSGAEANESDEIPPTDIQSAVAELADLRAAVERDQPACLEVFKEYDAADTRWMLAEQASALISGGLKVKADDFHLEASNPTAAKAAIEAASTQLCELANKLAPLERAVKRRFELEMHLHDDAKFAECLPECEKLSQEAKRLQVVSGEISRHWPAVLELRNDQASLSILLQHLQSNQTNEQLRSAIQAKMSSLTTQMRELRTALRPTLYPFEHGDKDTTIAQYALKHLPTSDDLPAVFQAVAEMLSQLGLLARRVASRLALIATKAETAVFDTPKESADTAVQVPKSPA